MSVLCVPQLYRISANTTLFSFTLLICTTLQLRDLSCDTQQILQERHTYLRILLLQGITVGLK